MTYNILTLNAIADCGLEQFPRDHYTIASDLENPDGILVRSQGMHEFSFNDNLKVVGRAGAGVNNIPVDKLTQLGIPVLNTPGANANAVKELVILGMLLASRHIFPAWDYVRQVKGDDQSIHEQVEKQKKQFVGSELFGKTLGVIGLGSIGVKVANIALALGMKVIGYDPAITVQRAWELSSNVEQAHNLDSLLGQSDFVTLHVPLIEATRHMMNAACFKAMKQGLVLLNFARDTIVDSAALSGALQDKKISAYVCDFPTAQFKDHPRVISLPHLGASTAEAEENCAVMVAKQVRAYLELGNIQNSVNFPQIEMPASTGFRLAVANANIPNMVAQISTVLASAQLNIIDLLNKSRGDVAYTLIDVNAPISEELLEKIRAIGGVLHVRRFTP